MQNLDESAASRRARIVLLSSVGALVIGTIGYFFLERETWTFYALAHLGALGLMGLFGWVAGVLARKKDRSYWTAFLFGALIPIFAGVVAVLIFLWGVNGQLYCGGSVSLLVATPVLLFYLFAKGKTPPQTGQAG